MSCRRLSCLTLLPLNCYPTYWWNVNWFHIPLLLPDEALTGVLKHVETTGTLHFLGREICRYSLWTPFAILRTSVFCNGSNDKVFWVRRIQAGTWPYDLSITGFFFILTHKDKRCPCRTHGSHKCERCFSSCPWSSTTRMCRASVWGCSAWRISVCQLLSAGIKSAHFLQNPNVMTYGNKWMPS